MSLRLAHVTNGLTRHRLGKLDVPAALGALGEVGYRGLVAVELSRHAHAAHETVPRAIAHLRAHEPAAAAVPG